VLLIGAGLLIQSLMRLQHVRLGFRPEGLLTFQLSLPPAKYQGPGKAWGFYRELLASLQSLPGVKAAAISSGIPFGAGNFTTTATAAVGKSLLPPGTAMEIPLLRGRDLTEQDGPTAPSVVVVSQTTANRFWGSEDPLGRVIRVVGSGREFTVVGVVGDAHNSNLSRDPAPAMYFSAVSRLQALTDVVVRTNGSPEAALPAVRSRVHDMDAELPVSTVRTMEQWVDGSAARPRLNAVLLAIFAAVAMLIAAIGIYGVLSYSVSRRTREIGLRMAIGAQRPDVMRLVVREGMLVALAGIGAGVLAALVASRALATLVFGVPVRDPGTFAAVAIVLAVVALSACCIPARRASRVDPIVALRDE
jgi:putative ABC transport system permease protein